MKLFRLLWCQLTYCLLGIGYNVVSYLAVSGGKPPLSANNPLLKLEYRSGGCCAKQSQLVLILLNVGDMRLWNLMAGRSVVRQTNPMSGFLGWE